MIDGLGYDDAQEFLKLWRGTPGRDFNRWLNEQPQKTVEEAAASADRTGNSDIAKRIFAGKIRITNTTPADKVGV
ncbi:hypothetical protein R80B4_03216 [Fibrobacteres bacterium R8-0-B4]